MGEIADMMIGGEMCEMCGVFLEDNDMGIPMYCSAVCARERGVPEKDIKYRVLREIGD